MRRKEKNEKTTKFFVRLKKVYVENDKCVDDGNFITKNSKNNRKSNYYFKLLSWNQIFFLIFHEYVNIQNWKSIHIIYRIFKKYTYICT